MTREEFSAQFGRLCEGHRFDATVKQTEAFYELLQHHDGEDFRVATTRLLAARGFPVSVDVIAREIDRAREERRRAAVLAERQQAAVTVSGRSVVSEQMLERYQGARMALVIEVCGSGPGTRMQKYVDGLSALLDNATMREWMKVEGMGTCALHKGDHSLYDCVTDELKFFMFKAEGCSTVEACRRLTPLARAPIDERLLIRTDGYGRVMADQMGVLKLEGSA